MIPRSIFSLSDWPSFSHKIFMFIFLSNRKWKHHSFGQIDHYKNIVHFSAVHAEMVSLITESRYQTNKTNMYIHIHSSYSTEWKIDILIKHFF